MKNVKLFQAFSREGFLVQLDISKLKMCESWSKDVLMKWLETNHNEIFWDIEAHEGGSVQVSGRDGNIEITFRGDNGLFTLCEIEAETITF